MRAYIARVLLVACITGSVLAGTAGAASASTDNFCMSFSWWFVRLNKVCVPVP